MNEMIYILGGVNDDKYLDTNEAYDTNANSWSGKAAMPTARAGLGLTAVETADSVNFSICIDNTQ